MHYENFSRHLREKYWTRLHIADQLVDQLKSSNQSFTSSDQFIQRTIVKAKKEISYPLISYLNEFNDHKLNHIETKTQLKPYFNECVLAAERLRNNRCSNRDRRICYENFILAQKLESIKKQTTRHLTNTSIKTRSIKTESSSINRHDSDKEESSKLVIVSDQSSRKSEDDQATTADVDGSMDFHDSTSSVYHTQRTISSDDWDTNSIDTHHKKFIVIQPDNIGSVHTASVFKPSPARHFSVYILPRYESGAVELKSNCSQVVKSDRPRAFKKEILYHRILQ